MSEAIAIVGSNGEVGRRLARGAAATGIEVRHVTRDTGHEWLRGPRGMPLVVCVREGALASVLEQVPVERDADLIVIQNGFVDELLQRREAVSRGVLWFTSKGSFFADLLPSPTHGPRAELLRALIIGAGASAQTIADEGVFRRAVVEKAVWSCVVGAPLAVWRTTLAEARETRMGDIERIVREACDAAAAELGVRVAADQVLATLDATAGRLGWMPGGTGAIDWRNAKVVTWGERHGVETPVNRAVVEAARG